MIPGSRTFRAERRLQFGPSAQHHCRCQPEPVAVRGWCWGRGRGWGWERVAKCTDHCECGTALDRHASCGLDAGARPQPRLSARLRLIRHTCCCDGSSFEQQHSEPEHICGVRVAQAECDHWTAGVFSGRSSPSPHIDSACTQPAAEPEPEGSSVHGRTGRAACRLGASRRLERAHVLHGPQPSRDAMGAPDVRPTARRLDGRSGCDGTLVLPARCLRAHAVGATRRDHQRNCQ